MGQIGDTPAEREAAEEPEPASARSSEAEPGQTARDPMRRVLGTESRRIISCIICSRSVLVQAKFDQIEPKPVPPSGQPRPRFL
jgi:hypothetical protein